MFRETISECLELKTSVDFVLSVDSVKKFFSDAKNRMKCYKKGDNQTNEIDTTLDAYCPIGKNEKFTSLINNQLLLVECDEQDKYQVTLDDVVKFTNKEKHQSCEFISGRKHNNIFSNNIE